MKLRLSSVPTLALLCMTLGCAEFEDRFGAEPTLPPPPPQEYTNPLTGGTTFPTQLRVTNFTTLKTDLTSAAATITSSPGTYWSTLSSGHRYTDFSVKSSWPAQANYIKRLHMVEPPADHVPMTETAFKAYINSELPKLGMSAAFNTYVKNTMDWVYYRLVNNLGNKVYFSTTTFGQTGFKQYCQGQMSQVKNNSALSEFEKFVLTQMYNGLLVQVEHAYYNPSPTLYSNGCLPQSKEEWKAVAETAAIHGLGWGVRLGIQGARAGAIATTAAGNPVAGGIIGGGIGFVIGFGYGAFMGGGGKLMVQCLWKKIASQLMTYDCGGRMILSWSATPPTGCTAMQTTSIAPSLKVVLTSIYEYGVVPNSGAYAINPTVTQNINDFIKYLNK